MTIPASEQYNGLVLESVATSKEMATKLQDDIAESKDGTVTMSLLEAQCLSSQLRFTANLIQGLLQEQRTTMVRVDELLDLAHSKKGKKR